MKKLSFDWFVDGLIDYEYKKYLLLAYLQNVEDAFSKNKLYPVLSDLVYHFRNLTNYKQNKINLEDQFPKKVSHIDWEKLSFIYQQNIPENNLIQEIDDIVDYAIIQVKEYIDKGTLLYNHIDSKIEIKPIGIVPIYKKEGYLFIQNGKEENILVYQYNIRIFGTEDDKSIGISINFLDTYEASINTTYETIKLKLLKIKKDLPNPATYSVESDTYYPAEETFVPITKRKLLSYIEV